MNFLESAPRSLLRFVDRLFEDAGERQALICSLLQPKQAPQALLWTKKRPDSPVFQLAEPLPWQPCFVDRVIEGQNCGSHELHTQGYFYCLDFSSVFAASTLLALPMPAHSILDVCSSPGGKAIFAACLLQPKRLLCNETIKKRLPQLKANLKRCGLANYQVLNCDPSELSSILGYPAELVLVDAPCSGQSLLAKGQAAQGCFHPQMINMNARRQRRIIAQAAGLVAPGGHLAYMTCTFSREENEKIIAWFIKHFPSFRPVPIPCLSTYLSAFANFPCYRLWPMSGLGAGAFTALLYRND